MFVFGTSSATLALTVLSIGSFRACGCAEIPVEGTGGKSFGKVDSMRWPSLFGMLCLSSFLSTLAAGQSAIHAGPVSSDSDPSPSVSVTEKGDLPEAPNASPVGRSGDAARDVSETHLVAPTLELEKTTLRSGHTLDRNLILLHAFSAAALVEDLETTVRGVQGQANRAELNPLFGAHPTRARLYGIAVPLNVLSFYVSYHYKKIEPGSRLWKLGPGISIAVHTAAAINNLVAAH